MSDKQITEPIVRRPCFFCTDCDAVRCDHEVLSKLRHIAEQAGKRQWWNVLHTINELNRVALVSLRYDIKMVLDGQDQ